MTQIVDINTRRQNTNVQLCLSEELESEFLGLTKQLCWRQMMDKYELSDIIKIMYSYLNSENRYIIDNFIDENPSLKVKYNNLESRELKQSVN